MINYSSSNSKFIWPQVFLGVDYDLKMISVNSKFHWHAPSVWHLSHFLDYCDRIIISMIKYLSVKSKFGTKFFWLVDYDLIIIKNPLARAPV